MGGGGGGQEAARKVIRMIAQEALDKETVVIKALTRCLNKIKHLASSGPQRARWQMLAGGIIDPTTRAETVGHVCVEQHITTSTPEEKFFKLQTAYQEDRSSRQWRNGVQLHDLAEAPLNREKTKIIPMTLPPPSTASTAGCGAFAVQSIHTVWRNNMVATCMGDDPDVALNYLFLCWDEARDLCISASAIRCIRRVLECRRQLVDSAFVDSSARAGNLRILELLHKSVPHLFGESTLHNAILSEHREAVTFLMVEKGISCPGAMATAALLKSSAMMDMLRSRGEVPTVDSMTAAATAGNLNTVRRLLLEDHIVPTEDTMISCVTNHQCFALLHSEGGGPITRAVLEECCKLGALRAVVHCLLVAGRNLVSDTAIENALTCPCPYPLGALVLLAGVSDFTELHFITAACAGRIRNIILMHLVTGKLHYNSCKRVVQRFRSMPKLVEVCLCVRWMYYLNE